MNAVRNFFIAAGALILLVGCGPSGYTFKVKPKQGQTFNYDMAVTSGGQNVDLKLVVTAESVNNNQTTFRTKVTGMSLAGQPTPPAILQQMQKATNVEVIDEYGNTISSRVEGDATNSLFSDSEGMIPTATFSPNPIKVGETWTTKAKDETDTFKLLSVEKQGDKELATMEATADEIQEMKLDGPAKFVIDTATGMPVSLTMSGATKEGKVAINLKLES